MDLRNSQGRRELGRRIQSAIAESGYKSIPAFAERLGCSRALIYQYVKGDVLVQLDRLQEIAELTGRDLEWFLDTSAQGRAAEVAALAAELSTDRAQLAATEQALASERKLRDRYLEQSRRTLAQTLREVCLAHRKCGDSAALVEAATRLLELAVDLHDRELGVQANLHLGHAWLNASNHERAERALHEALQIALAQGNAAGEQSARQELIRLFQATGRIREAREQAQDVSASSRWWPRWAGRVAQAAIAEQVGDLPEARSLLDAAAQVIEDTDEPLERKINARTYLASNEVNLSLARGRYLEAIARCENLRAWAEQAGLRDQLREAALNLGLCRLRNGEVSAAAQEFAQLAQWAAFAGDRRVSFLVQVFESERLRRCGDLAGAKRTALAVADEGMAAGSGYLLGEAEFAMGEVYRAEGHLTEATHYLTRCRDRAERLELARLKLAAELALAAVPKGGPRSTALWSRLTKRAEEIGYQDLHVEALLGLAGRANTPEGTLETAARARTQAEACGYFWGRLAALRLESRAHLECGDLEAAAHRLTALLGLASVRLGDEARAELFAPEGEIRAALARAYRGAGKNEQANFWEALDLMRSAPSGFIEAFNQGEL
jgi:transcriptional regulator with XRE-family HTH domain